VPPSHSNEGAILQWQEYVTCIEVGVISAQLPTLVSHPCMTGLLHFFGRDVTSVFEGKEDRMRLAKGCDYPVAKDVLCFLIPGDNVLCHVQVNHSIVPGAFCRQVQPFKCQQVRPWLQRLPLGNRKQFFSDSS
jgi:hypothetical protein